MASKKAKKNAAAKPTRAPGKPTVEAKPEQQPKQKPTSKPHPKPTTSAMAGKLQHAAKTNDVEAARALLERGVDPNFLINGSSILATGVYWGNESVVRVLLEHGADPNLGDSFPSAGGAMHSASAEGRVELLALLLAHDGDPNARGQHGRGPLQSALQTVRSARKGTFGLPKPPRARLLATIGALLAAGARPDLADDRGNTGISEAEKTGDAQIIALVGGAAAARRG